MPTTLTQRREYIRMKKILYILVLASLACNLPACQKAPRAEQQGILVDINPTVAEMPATKHVIFPGESNGSGGYYMPNNSNFGLYVCDHHTGSYTDGSNPYNEYTKRYNNIQVSRGSGIWYYNYIGYAAFTTLYIVPKDEDEDGVTDNTCDFFAYAPYQNGVIPDSVPFTIAGFVDAMYPEQNGVSNLNIDPADYLPAPYNGHLPVALTFHHALALLEFDFRLKNPNYEHPMDPTGTHGYTLNSIRVSRQGGHLYSSGRMNAMRSGELSSLTDVSSITCGYNVGVSVNSNPAIAYMLQVPTRPGEDYQDGDYVFTFTFSGQTFPVTFTLLREHLRHGTSSTYGFLPGYKYTFSFLIDNYIHFEGVTVGEWETVTAPAMQTEI